MTIDIKIDKDRKIIHRTVTGEITTNSAVTLVQNITLATKLHQGYNILVDIRDTTFYPEMTDLLEIATECSRQLIGFNNKIAFLIPNTEQRKQVAKLFKTCMETQGFVFTQFFDYESAVKWLSVEE